MKAARLLIVLVAAAALSSCGTRPKTYVAPSGAHVEKQTKRVAAAVKSATESAARAQTKVADAKTKADTISADSIAIADRVDKLEAVVPPEVVPQVVELRGSIEALQAQERDLVALLEDAKREHEQLAKDLHEAKVARIDLEIAQAGYKRDAEKLARSATEERDFRIAAEKQLFRQKLFGALWKIGGAVAIVGALVLAFLWFTGRIAFAGAKLIS